MCWQIKAKDMKAVNEQANLSWEVLDSEPEK